jgi:hypothetical protein
MRIKLLAVLTVPLVAVVTMVPSVTAHASGWSGWESLGGSYNSAPAVASWGSGRLDLFTIGSGSVQHRWYSGGQWSGTEDLGGQSFFEPACCYEPPAAVSWGPGRIDLFVRGTDSNLWHKWYSGGWSGWENLGGPIASAPTAASWGSGRLDVFAVGPAGSVVHKFYDGSWWSGFESLAGIPFFRSPPCQEIGTICYEPPAAVSWGPGRIDVFIRGQSGIVVGLSHKWYSGGWSDWENMGGPIGSAPTVASWGSGRLDVFATAANHNVVHKFYDGGWSSGYEDLGGTAFPDIYCCDSGPAAVSWGSGRIDVFVRGLDSAVWHKWWQ